MKLWLDDLRAAPGGFHHAKNADQALHALQSGQVTEASLDHDLGHPAKNGWWVLKVAQQHGLPLPEVVHLHTQNPVGRERMIAVLEHDLGYERDFNHFATWRLPAQG